MASLLSAIGSVCSTVDIAADGVCVMLSDWRNGLLLESYDSLGSTPQEVAASLKKIEDMRAYHKAARDGKPYTHPALDNTTAE